MKKSPLPKFGDLIRFLLLALMAFTVLTIPKLQNYILHTIAMKNFLLLLTCLCPLGCTQFSNPAVAQFTPLPYANTDAKKAQKVSMSRLKRLSAGVVLFAEKNQNHLPDLSNSETLYKEVSPLLPIGSNEVFIHPVTGEPYATNSTATGLDVGGFPRDTFSGRVDTSKTVIIYEATPDTDNTRGVIYMNGTAGRVSESRWELILVQSRIP